VTLDSEPRSSGLRRSFPPTQTSVLRAVGDADDAVRRRALDAVVLSYWKPVYTYLRLKWNATHDEAKDLTQGFFLNVLVRGSLRHYDPAKARFRTYLRTCLDSFAANERKAARRLKRGGAFRHLSLDFETAEGELPARDIPDPLDADAFFQREWVRSLFAIAVTSFRQHCESTGRELHYRLFERYDLDPPHDDEKITYADLAEEFDIDVTKVTNTLHAARRKFRELLLERLHDMCGSEREFQEEARALLGIDP